MYLTFPGRIFYNFIKALFCVITRVEIIGAKYFQKQYPFGKIEFRQPVSNKQLFWIITGPFLICSFFAFAIGTCGIIPFFSLGVYPFEFNVITVTRYMQIYIGFCVGVNAFPDIQGLRELIEVCKKNKNILVKITGTPVFLLMLQIVKWSALWLNAAYGVFCITAVPLLLTM